MGLMVFFSCWWVWGWKVWDWVLKVYEMVGVVGNERWFLVCVGKEEEMEEILELGLVV